MDRGRKGWTLPEAAVFGLALCLLAFLAYHFGRGALARAWPVRSSAESPAAGESEPSAGRTGSATHLAVTSIPPIKLSQAGSTRRWAPEVPAPAAGRRK